MEYEKVDGVLETFRTQCVYSSSSVLQSWLHTSFSEREVHSVLESRESILRDVDLHEW